MAMGRRRAEPLTTSVNAVADQLVRAHGWSPHVPEVNAERVADHARAAGLDVPDYWTPTLTATQARDLLAAILAVPDPLEVAQAREADPMASPILRPAEQARLLGVAGVVNGMPTVTAVFGPGDDGAPERSRERAQAIAAGKLE